MATIKRFRVIPSLPESLQPLMKIAKNLWWVWNFEAIELFRRLNVDLWRELHHNPVAFLGSISQKELEEVAKSESFIAHLNRVTEELEWHMTKRSWFEENYPESRDMQVAYFSAEFGLHECLPIYSGGLGVLAGDHLKSSSEIGVPLCGVGLLYRLGYFHQYLNIDGWQQEAFPETDFFNIPISIMKDEQGQPISISVEFPGRVVHAHIWEVRIGRISLYLLDTNIDQNAIEDRAITDQLYGGDLEMRIKQELLLGVGGVRALKRLGKRITVYHMNEGHSAFLAVERIRDVMMTERLAFREALEFVTAGNVFTTHTPVPAGNDRFPGELIEKYLSHYYAPLGLAKEAFMGLGRENPTDKNETFCMTVLALRTAASCNGVSKLHGSVSRAMWRNIWPSLPVHEVPIDHITNGVQILSWTSDEMMRLLNRYLGPRWIDNPVDRDIWNNVDSIPDSELWRTRERLRERLIVFARRVLKSQLATRGLPKNEVDRSDSVLDADALTIGFARRFATYKRGTLIMKNMDRLEKILLNRERPVQIIFAGKAHPHDNLGKELIKHIVNLVRDERFRNKIVFLEDYDINIARNMVQGVDVWLNTPIRPLEASGTSGMKVVPNGALNLSILDGWWNEGYNGKNGWAIGRGEEYLDHGYQDEVESLSLYNILEKDLIPSFYSRGADGLPHEWVTKIKESMKTLCPQFNTNRMVRDYAEKFYIPAHHHERAFSENEYRVSRDLAKWKSAVVAGWNKVSIRDLIYGEEREIALGSRLKVRAQVDLGGLAPQDVQVELYFGALNQDGEIFEGASLPMFPVEDHGGGQHAYEGHMLCLKSGQFGFTVRAIPMHDNLVRKFEPRLIAWA
ncbi:MAG TPA: alpha-glucan family phosphorylase [Spirochaetota bacterium]|mgnify:CR=1 FL=1|nr:alpha-glucan family phosphorylase [Spirochaetota bacterium]HNT10376.1 alpha-glucan family phosphorylase [Spirochaetota bacterium]HNV47536.1 alpha-glucan family phosphorylase [Spirochaetota bacterium]HOS40371.1 alpha-glucan family phosphorylase [Spirochaetota bacterium]